MSGTAKETPLIRPPVKGENWEGQLNIIYNYLHNQKKGPLLRNLNRPECKGEEVGRQSVTHIPSPPRISVVIQVFKSEQVPGVFVPNDVWHFGYIRWMGIEIWVRSVYRCQRSITLKHQTMKVE